MLKALSEFLRTSEYIVENAALRRRVADLETAIRQVVSEQGDNLCWLDAYTRLAKLVGVEFDPLLLSPDQMLRNCEKFVHALHAGCPYRTGDCVGIYEPLTPDTSLFVCGHCDFPWYAATGGDKVPSRFCPHCGQQQHFERTESII